MSLQTQPPQSQLVMHRHIGRHRSGYLVRELDSANEAVKQPLRERVLQYFLGLHRPGNLRCLSLPGERWLFEAMLQQAWPYNSTFVGVEREISVIRRSLGWMPRLRRRERPAWQTWPLTGGCINYLATDNAKLMHADLFDVLHISREDHAPADTGSDNSRNKRRLKWADKFRRWTCAWLDLTTFLHVDLEASLSRLSAGFDRYRQVCPIALTLSVGHEKQDQMARVRAVATDRADYVARVLHHSRYRTFELDHVVPYRSVAGCNMLLIMGRALLRAEYAVDALVADRTRRTPPDRHDGGTAYRRPAGPVPDAAFNVDGTFAGGDYFSFGGERRGTMGRHADVGTADRPDRQR
jgi:hypothetical protein